ncbi:Predicted transcriptional regulator, contains HTH domain [Flavobacterium micromati]|uniref:Predicted transcriptional regulator, contains HTH domain n=1 Tax=Flavobacterium micromati TaxID=229205 RepID=A0A1M5INP5_9FLAO|nr:RNA-binding domain-containing protein [Flavobacterium micromati]SHG29570.1 Predicted transcriptional regulator, contains HTH domain [Flavobacterium micromati]
MPLIDKTLEIIEHCLKNNSYKEVETERIELKDLSNNGKWTELYSTVCAFLNTNGGNIIIGINENVRDKKYKFTGFNYHDENKLKELSEKFTDKLGNSKHLLNYFPNYEIRDFLDGKVAIIYVEKLPEDEKFVYHNKIAYKRKFTGDHKLTEKEIKAQEELKIELINAQELSIVPNTSIELINIEKLNEYIVQLNIGKKVETLKADLTTAIPFLNRKGFVREGSPTLLGMLVCGDYVEDYIQGKCEVDCYVEVKNKIAEDKQIYRENIIDLIQKSVNFVFRNTKVGITSEKGGTAQPEYPEDLVREIVNNALAHRDYKSNRFIIIEIRPNKNLMIQNPGSFQEKQRLHVDTNQGKIRRIIPIQYARNPKLTDLLKSFNRWEGKGKGLASLTDACLENLIDMPYYILSEDEIKLFVPKGKVYDDKMEIWLKCYAGYLSEKYGKELSEEENVILSYFYKSETLNRLDRYTILLTSDNNHKNIISNLEEKGLLIKNNNSTEIYPVYIVDRVLTETDYSAKLNTIFKSDFELLPDKYKNVLNAIYQHSTFGNQNEILGANSIGNFIYFSENKSIEDSKKFENFKRTIRTIFNKLEEKKFIVRKNNKKSDFKINRSYQHLSDLFENKT